MIYTKSIYSRITVLLMITALLLLIALLVIGITEYRKSEARMKREVSLLFEQAIYEEVNLKMSEEFVFIHKGKESSHKNNIIKTQKIVTADIIFTDEAEISNNVDLELIKSSQSYLLNKGRIQPDTLLQIFDSKLKENGINIASVILVKYDHNVLTSEDTTLFRADYRIPVIRGGIFGEIIYEGLIDYSPAIIFRSMSKSGIILLLTLVIIMLIAIFYQTIKKQKIKPDKIVKKGRFIYIGMSVFDARKNELIGQNKKVVQVTKMPAEILLMFLNNDDHIVEKNVLKETFWSESPLSANQSMTSAINKIRNCLKEVDCTFKIITKKGDDYYVLKYIQEETENNNTNL